LTSPSCSAASRSRVTISAVGWKGSATVSPFTPIAARSSPSTRASSAGAAGTWPLSSPASRSSSARSALVAWVIVIGSVMLVSSVTVKTSMPDTNTF